MIVNADEILKSISIDRIVSDYVKLSRRGANLIGSCPFHNENTASFSVSPAKGIYKCFGCGKGGNNAAKFLMDRDGISFPEALEIISSKTGITIEYEEGQNREAVIAAYRERKSKREAQIAVMAKVYDQYIEQCTPAPGEYAGKTYTAETIKKWKLTILNKSKLTLTDQERGIALDEIGILGRNEAGKVYDKFYKRLCFPIHHVSGYIEGITARTLDKDKAPKYLNSQDSLLYNKSESLFGIFYNSKHILAEGSAILVEGPTDVIMLDQAGISNAIGSCGTALTLEHAKLISRYTDIVYILRDPDAAGVKATVNDVEMFTKAQVECQVVALPDGKDPADFINEVGPADFREYLVAHAIDGIEWRVTQEVKGQKSEFKKIGAINVTARLLSYIDSDTLKEQYITKLAKIIDTKQKHITEALNEEIDKTLAKVKKLSTQQEIDKAKYGLYIHKQNYLDYKDTTLSNFIMKPLFLVRAGERSYRLFEIINDEMEIVLLSINSEDVTTLNSYIKKIEMYGNYIFYGGASDYTRLKRLVYSEMKKAHQLPHLGYIESSGVYAWGNGITTPEGDFLPVNDYGVVAFDNLNYYLPAFSNISLQDVIKTNDDSDYERKFIFGRCDLTPLRWMQMFTELFGDNSTIGIGFYIASIFRDFLQEKNSNFPILNLFGPPGSGKSTMAEGISYMFGQLITPIHCITATDAAFYRRPGQCRNSVTVYEEYSEMVDKKRQQALKAHYDGYSRPMAKKESSNKNESQPVLSSTIIIGQVLPTHDPALLERCITLFFDEKSKSSKGDALVKIKSLGKKGQLSHITAWIHSKRKDIIATYEEMYPLFREKLLAAFGDTKPKDRLVISYTAVLTMYFSFIAALEKQYETDCKLDDNKLIKFISDRIKVQMAVNEGATELQEFWQMFEFLCRKGIIKLDTFAVKEEVSVTVYNEDKTGTVQKNFPVKTKILYFHLNTVHREYMTYAKNQLVQRTLDSNTIKVYLQQHKAYVGETKGTRLNGHSPQRCWAFELEKIPGIELNVTNNQGFGDGPDFPVD